MSMNLEATLYNNLGDYEIEQIKEILGLPEHYDFDDVIEYIIDNLDDEDILNDIEDILNDNYIYLEDYLD